MYPFELEELEIEENIIMSEAVKNYLEIISKSKDLSKEEEIICINNIDNPIYKQKLFESYLKLVVGIAKRYSFLKIPLEDLIQEGITGLQAALEKFDVSKECRFSTIATWWIKCKILSYVKDNMRVFRIPSNYSSKIQSVSKAAYTLYAENNKYPSNKDIAEYLSISVGEVERLKSFLLPVQSFNERVYTNSEEVYLEDTIEDEGKNALEALVYFEDIQFIQNALNKLPEIQKFILINRYGLENNKEKTLKQIGRELNLSSERVRQLQEEAERSMYFELKKEFR